LPAIRLTYAREKKVNNPKLKLLINKYEKSNKTRSLHHGYRKHLLPVGKMAQQSKPTIVIQHSWETYKQETSEHSYNIREGKT